MAERWTNFKRTAVAGLRGTDLHGWTARRFEISSAAESGHGGGGPECFWRRWQRSPRFDWDYRPAVRSRGRFAQLFVERARQHPPDGLMFQRRQPATIRRSLGLAGQQHRVVVDQCGKLRPLQYTNPES